MSSKRSKFTIDKARERITSLEESILAREQKLDQLKSRLSRSVTPDKKLIAAEERLERKLVLERDQVQKLRRLLSRRNITAVPDSSEDFHSEEIDGLHRSFEEVRLDLTQMKARLESVDIPRDLPTRLTSFEERINRREEVDSDLYSQILGLRNTLDQERQTVRRISRRFREHDQSIEALREAVEDSVVATVDLAERLDELEENVSPEEESVSAEEETRSTQVEPGSARKDNHSAQGECTESLRQTLAELEARFETIEDKLISLEEFTELVERLGQLESQWDELERSIKGGAPATSSGAPAASSGAPASSSKAQVVERAADAADLSNWVVANFGDQQDTTRGWKPAKFQSTRRKGDVLETL